MLSKGALIRVAPMVRAKLGKNKDRFDGLLALVSEEGTANLASVLKRLYPGQPDNEKAQASLRQFRLEIEKAANKAGVQFELAGDGKTRTPLEERHVWFEGEDQAAAPEYWTGPKLAGPKVYEPQNARRIWPKHLYFVYAERDSADAAKLLDELRPLLQGEDIEVTTNHDVLPGRIRHSERARARETCDLSLQLASPAFAADELWEERCPRSIPVSLYPLPEYPDDVAVFQHKGKGFGQLAVAAQRKAFALELHQEIGRWLASHEQRLAQEFGERIRPEKDYLNQSAREVSLAQDLEQAGPAQPDANQTDAITLLETWLDNPNGAPYCALLGELGIGKTTTAKQLARRQWEKRSRGENARVAIYLDLRLVGKFARQDPELDDNVARILKRDYNEAALQRPPEVSEVYRLAKQGALIIFDGLDEVLVHLEKSEWNHFTRQLFRILPPGEETRGRMMITCRTHFFRTVKEQTAQFTLQKREGIEEESYLGLMLLPFGEQQVRTYLANSFPDRNADEMYKFLESVHNLVELSQRPLTLQMITRQFARLEQMKAAGKRVTGLTLYRFVVDEWLLRDDGKHKLTPQHKQLLMEHVAAELARSGGRSWTADQLEDWLVGFVGRELKDHYHGVARELLKKDLEGATFLVRDDTDRFQFAHSSLQEYFLAFYLRRALEQGRLADWALAGVSRETLDFLGQSLQETPSEAAERGLAALKEEFVPHSSQLALQYFVIAQQQGYPSPGARGIQLAGADLFGFELRGAGLDLRGANFRGAQLANSYWRGCQFSGAHFGGAQAERAEWHECDLSGSAWGGADLGAAIFRNCLLNQARFEDARTARAAWLRCEGGPAHPLSGAVGQDQIQQGHTNSVSACGWSPDARRVVSASDDHTLKLWDAETGQCLRTLTGHKSSVSACGWSPDARRVVSASSDNTLKLWDAETGQCLRTLTGHTSSVSACGWSPDARRVVSASSDQTLKLWDAETGQCLRTLTGHTSYVRACGWSPDARRVVSASLDNTLKLWDVETGQCLRTLTGHTSLVTACGWSPDARRVVSASDDHTLKLWDAETGQCLRTLTGHKSSVYACGWSPDARRVVSASYDDTLKLWDAETGQCLRTLTGHKSSVSACGWSPDARRVVSASYDKTLKLWDAETGQCLRTLTGHTSLVSACGWSPDARRVVSASYDQTLKLWDAETGQCLRTLTGHTSLVSACGWSPDARRVVSASYDQTLKLWDAETGQCLRTLTGHTSLVNACGWSPDARRVVSASDDQMLKLWDAETGQCLRTLTGHTSSVSACGWSPDARRVVSASDDQMLKLWDAETGQCLRTLTGHTSLVSACGWSPDARRVVSASSDHTLKLWDAETGQCLRTLTGHTSSVTACGWSPDARRVVSASSDHTLKLWDAETGQCLRTLTGHTSSVTACEWSPDARRLAAAYAGGYVTLFDADTGAEVGPQLFHLTERGEPTWAAYDPVAQRVLGHGEDAWRSVGSVVVEEGEGLRWIGLRWIGLRWIGVEEVAAT